MMELVTQGAPSGSCRCGRPGLLSAALPGLHKEEAASCRFTNVQSPSRRKGALNEALFYQIQGELSVNSID
jgi:hypothetical protein